MGAKPYLASIAEALADCRLEAVLIGNAGAALQGAPVTTLDFDFCFRSTPGNIEKVRRFAERMRGSLTQPYEPVSALMRVELPQAGVHVDFLPDTAIGARVASLRSRASKVTFGEARILVADLRDIAKGKRKAGRPKDKAALYAIEKTIEEKT